MKTLKELIGILDYGYDEMDVIKLYLSQPDIMPKAVEVLTGLLKGEIDRLEKFKSKNMAFQPIPYDFYYKKYPMNIARMLDTLSRKSILEMQYSDDDIAWIKENVPKINIPKVGLKMFIDDVHKIGIYFKDEEKPV